MSMGFNGITFIIVWGTDLVTTNNDNHKGFISIRLQGYCNFIGMIKLPQLLEGIWKQKFSLFMSSLLYLDNANKILTLYKQYHQTMFSH